jgi:phage terminase large subunit-like protein
MVLNNLSFLDDLSDKERQAILSEVTGLLSLEKIADYSPYEKQELFHSFGATYRERLLRAGNQNGKSFCVGAEAAYHLTGNYPDWWAGRRWDRPTVVWASGETGEATRDNPQRVLLGNPKEEGTGAIPARCIGDRGMAMGVANLYDYVKIKHNSGGWSLLRFKYYAQGRRKWQGPPVDFVWFDEEPPEDIYDEGLARTIATGGMAAMSFTPLQGMSSVVLRFLGKDRTDERAEVNMTIDDALHIPAAERAKIIASFPAHEREARAKGIPTLGSGRIFPVEEDSILVRPFKIPDYWVQIVGVDFGWDHPSAAVRIAWDRDSDCIYITNTHRAKAQTPVLFAPSVKAWGDWIPVAWPHDGLQHDKGSGEQLAAQYKAAGLNMLKEHAAFEDGSNGVEAGLMEMLDRMQTGRLKVFDTLVDWFEEFRLYHRKDGRVVKEMDDLLSATRYAIMMKRRATISAKKNQPVARSYHQLDSGVGY